MCIIIMCNIELINKICLYKKKKKKKKKKRAQSHSPAQRLRGMDDSCYILFNLFVS